MGAGCSSSQIDACDKALERGRQSHSLYLTDQELKSVPPAAMEATGLQRVDLSRNKLAELPPSVGGLGNLQAMFVRDNRLHGLPEELGLCVALEEIHADRNLLTTLPDSIGQLVNLRMLRLRDNRLQTVPSSLGNCSSLQCLDVRRPPLDASVSPAPSSHLTPVCDFPF